MTVSRTANRTDTRHSTLDPAAFARADAHGEIALYFLASASGAEVAICNRGATVVEWLAPTSDRQLRSIVLGYESLPAYERDPSFQGCVPGRCANRIAGGRFELGGKTYQLPTNDGPNALHGGHEGLWSQVWEATPEPDYPAGESLLLTVESPDGEGGYPGNVRVSVRYTLTPEGHLQIAYQGTTDAPTVMNLTNHAYFNLDDAGTITDHVVQTPAEHILAIDQVAIPTGELLPVAGTPFDFRSGAALGPRLSQQHPQLVAGHGIDHHFVLGERRTTPRFAARLNTGDAALEMWTTEPGFQLYTGNMLELTPDSRRGRGWHPREGVCLEAQIHPDAINHPSFPSPVITPDVPYAQVTEYRWLPR